MKKETETNHTPGPWRVVPIGSEAYIGWNGNGFLADMRRNEAENEAEVAKCDANARLIAAAPDLLRVARYTLARLEHGPDANPNDGLLSDVRAAIEKAS